jgi:dienelactone hydrolase
MPLSSSGSSADPFDGFDRVPFTAEGRTYPLFRIGSGPGIVVMTEMPGISPKVAGFGRRLADEGFTAVLPSMFGTPGREPSIAYGLQSMIPACVAKEFAALASEKTAPVTSWLRALAKKVHAECGGPGVGAVGMCFTGGFALGMMLDETTVAPVLSQPSLPIAVSKSRRGAIGLSPVDLAAVKARATAGCDVLALRFTGDKFVPKERFETLRRELGDRFIGVEIDSSEGNSHGIPKNAHSVLTEHLVDEPGHPTHDALNQVIAFFKDRLAA